MSSTTARAETPCLKPNKTKCCAVSAYSLSVKDLTHACVYMCVCPCVDSQRMT